jgi:hypothetical protein
MGFRWVMAVVLATAALVASSCGGSSKSLTHAELTAQADAACKTLHTQLEALVRSKTSGSTAQAFVQAAAYEQAALTTMEKLNPPADVAADWKQILAGVRTLKDDSTKYSEYTKAGNTSGARVLANSYGPVKHKVKETARRAGIAECAQAL